MTHDLNISTPQADIVIVGAGPVGLWTAIQIKKRQPTIKIDIHERHESYVRSHVLRLDHLSLLLYCKNSRDQREQLFYQEALGQNAQLKPKKSVYIRTNILEAALRRYAQDLGIKIILSEIVSPEQVESHYPATSCFIAADGAHSRMRRKLLGNNDIISKSLQYVVEFKYEVRGNSRPLNFIKEGYKTQKILSFMTFEYVGRTLQDLTPVTLRLFVDRVTYDAIPAATFKNPLALNFNQLPARLVKDLNTYLNVRRQLTAEEYIVDSGKLTKLVLSAYRARRFSLDHNGNAWFLVGDAAMGVPYFRALNCGMLCSSLLAGICARLSQDGQSKKSAFIAYNWFATMRFLTELFIALGKNWILRITDLYRRYGAMVPWQTTKWTDEEVFAYKTQEHYAFENEGN